jgi:hypothetical protein
MNFLTFVAIGVFIFIVAPVLTVAVPAFFSAVFGSWGIPIGILIGFALIMKIGGMI